MTSSTPPSYREPSVIVDVDEPAPTYTPQNILGTDIVKMVLKTSNSDTNHTNNNIIPNQQIHEQAQQQQAQQFRRAKRSGCCSCVKSLIITVFFITLFLLPVIIDAANPSRTWCWVWEEDCHHDGEGNVTRNAATNATTLTSTSLTGIAPSKTEPVLGSASSTAFVLSKEMDVGRESLVDTTRAMEAVLERRHNGLQTTFATRTRDALMVQRTGN